jgi:hypothetical protein
MTRMSVEELMEALRSRYVKASRRQKSKILDEFAAVTGFHRKAAIRRLGSVRRTRGKRRGRPPLHTPDVVAALRSVWEVRGCICSKEKRTDAGKVWKRYDKARTPYRRALAEASVGRSLKQGDGVWSCNDTSSSSAQLDSRRRTRRLTVAWWTPRCEASFFSVTPWSRVASSRRRCPLEWSRWS